MTTDTSPTRLLVLSYCFPPFNDTSGIVAAKRLREWGEPFDVIYKGLARIRPLDGSLTRLLGPLVRRHAEIPGPQAFASWGPISTFVREGMDVALRWDAADGPYERIYSRAHMTASHFLAAQFKIVRPHVHWRAEFSDPLSHDVFGNPRRLVSMADDGLARGLRGALLDRGWTPPAVPGVYEWAEALPFALADELIFTNEIQRDFMVEHCHDRRLAQRVHERSTIRAHPTLPREYYSMHPSGYPLDPTLINVAYFGNLYANRGLSLVLDAMSGLDSADRGRLHLHVFTSKPAELDEQLRRPELRGVVSAGPYVDYLEFLALADRMDVLMVNDAETPGAGVSPFLPSKWSDYRGSSAAVWGIVEHASTLSLQDLDYRSPLNSLSATQQVLVQLVRGTPGKPSPAHI